MVDTREGQTLTRWPSFSRGGPGWREPSRNTLRDPYLL